MTTATVLWHESSFHSPLPRVTPFLPDHCAVFSLLYIVNLKLMISRNNVGRELSVMLPCLLAWQFDMDVSSLKNALFSWTLSSLFRALFFTMFSVLRAIRLRHFVIDVLFKDDFLWGISVALYIVT